MPTFQICLNDTDAPYAETYAEITAACPGATIELVGHHHRDDDLHNITVADDQVAALAAWYCFDLDDFIAEHQI